MSRLNSRHVIFADKKFISGYYESFLVYFLKEYGHVLSFTVPYFSIKKYRWKHQTYLSVSKEDDSVKGLIRGLFNWNWNPSTVRLALKTIIITTDWLFAMGSPSFVWGPKMLPNGLAFVTTHSIQTKWLSLLITVVIYAMETWKFTISKNFKV